MVTKKQPSFRNILQHAAHRRAFMFSLLIVGALIAFEIFNYSTTDFAMSDLLGDLKFGGLRWATILAIAFCGIDFAGIARLFTPETGADETKEVWYLFGAWLLAATMNAILTWWGVSIAILQHQSLGSAVISRDVLLKSVPIFVALMVWLSRVLIIGTFSVAGERLFWENEPFSTPLIKPSQPKASNQRSRPATRPTAQRPTRTIPRSTPVNRPVYSNAFSPSPKPQLHDNSIPAPIKMDSNSSQESRNFS
jgi:hypothetical protein